MRVLAVVAMSLLTSCGPRELKVSARAGESPAEPHGGGVTDSAAVASDDLECQRKAGDAAAGVVSIDLLLRDPSWSGFNARLAEWGFERNWSTVTSGSMLPQRVVDTFQTGDVAMQSRRFGADGFPESVIYVIVPARIGVPRGDVDFDVSEFVVVQLVPSLEITEVKLGRFDPPKIP